MSICNCNNNTVVGRSKCPADRVVTPQDKCPMAPTTIEFEVETPTNFISGLDGKSAYEYAKDGGYEKSEEDFYSDLGKLDDFQGQVEDFNHRLDDIEEHGLAGKYLLIVDDFSEAPAQDGERVLYVGPTEGGYENGRTYQYSSQTQEWTQAYFQPQPEPPDLTEINASIATFNSFLNDTDTVDSTINKWKEMESFLEGMSDTDSLTGILENERQATQDALDGKQNTINGAASTITSTNLTGDRALVSNAQGKVAVSQVSATELSYLSGVSRPVQSQLDDKQDVLTFDSTPTLGSSRPVMSNGIRLAIDAASALNRLRFSTASAISYNLSTVDTSTFQVNDILTITDLGANSLRYMASGAQRTFTGPFDFDLMFRWTGTEFRPLFPFMNWDEHN